MIKTARLLLLALCLAGIPASVRADESSGVERTPPPVIAPPPPVCNVGGTDITIPYPADGFLLMPEMFRDKLTELMPEGFDLLACFMRPEDPLMDDYVYGVILERAFAKASMDTRRFGRFMEMAEAEIPKCDPFEKFKTIDFYRLKVGHPVDLGWLFDRPTEIAVARAGTYVFGETIPQMVIGSSVMLVKGKMINFFIAMRHRDENDLVWINAELEAWAARFRELYPAGDEK